MIDYWLVSTLAYELVGLATTVVLAVEVVFAVLLVTLDVAVVLVSASLLKFLRKFLDSV